jgi:hypothetical protein
MLTVMDDIADLAALVVPDSILDQEHGLLERRIVPR